MSIGNLIRAGLERGGYVMWKREFLRYGVDPLLDIQRLGRRWGRPVKVAFDIGANVGQTAREFLKAFPAARVHAFEPHPTTFRELQKLSDPRLRQHNLALGETSGSVTMYEYGETGGASLRNSLAPNARTASQFGYQATERSVACTTLDAFCADQGIDRVDLLKIDVEGFELAVLKGGPKMLEDVAFIYLEFNDLVPRDDADGGALLPIAQYLAPFGFRFAATYTDFLEVEGQFFAVANALFVKV